MRIARSMVIVAALLASAASAPAALLRVPAHHPTVESAAAVAVAGDVILLDAGTYLISEAVALPSGVSLRGVSPEPGGVVMVGDGDGSGFVDITGPASTLPMTIANLTFRDGGTGVHCYGLDDGQVDALVENCRFLDGQAPAIRTVNTGASSIRIRRCEFRGNHAEDGAAFSGVSCEGVRFERCLFVDNHASIAGAVAALGMTATPEPLFDRCTFVANGDQSAMYPTLFVAGSAQISVSRSIVAFNPVRMLHAGSTGSLWITDSDVYGNAGPGVGPGEGNFSLDPLFCGPANSDNPYTLNSVSPCAAANTGGLGLIGAFGAACGDVRQVSGHVIDGRGRPRPGVVIAGAPDAVATDSSGVYEAMVPAYWSGDLGPQLAVETADPTQRSYDYLAWSLSDQDFRTAVPAPTAIDTVQTYDPQTGAPASPYGDLLVQVHGVACGAWGGLVYVQDPQAGVAVEIGPGVAPGDSLRVEGRARALTGGEWFLADAELLAQAPGPPPEPAEVPLVALAADLEQVGRFVTTRGRVAAVEVADPPAISLLVLADGDHELVVEVAPALGFDAGAVDLGTIWQVRGVCGVMAGELRLRPLAAGDLDLIENLQLPYTETFDDGTADFFDVVSGVWDVVDGSYHCRNDAPGQRHVSVIGNPQWTDYRATVDLRSAGAPGRELLFRYQDADHWYLLQLLSAPQDQASLWKCSGGEPLQMLQVENVANHQDQIQSLTVEVTGEVITAFLDGVRLFQFRDTSAPLLSGRVAVSTYADPAVGWSEIWIDQLRLLAAGDAVDAPAVPVALRLSCYPNPFNPRTTLAFTVDRPGPTRLRIFDVGGRLVRTLVAGPVGQGTHQVIWRGRDDAGREVPSGVYLSRLEASGGVASGRMVLVR